MRWTSFRYLFTFALLTAGLRLLGQAAQLWSIAANDEGRIIDSLAQRQAEEPGKVYYGFYRAHESRLLASKSGTGDDTKLHFNWPGQLLGSHFYLDLGKLAPEDHLWHLKDGDSIRLSNLEREQIFSPLIHGEDQLWLEDRPPLNNSEVWSTGQIVAPLKRNQRDFGDSGPCQVNAACSPEDQFPAIKRASLRYLWVQGGIAGWCSGTLVNNTAYDFKAYVLSAEHCALNNGFASDADLRRWVFFFNYHSRECINPRSESDFQFWSLVGCQLRARSDDGGGDFGSDFLLVELLRSIPPHFEAFFAGWSRLEEPPRRGVSYHHPAGDIMKVSTYRERATSASFAGNVPDTHYQVRWDPTPNGHGTSEPGSSGAALLDDQALIRGVLTGGASSCNNRVAPDFYGRFDYSWDRNGELASQRLAPWLDPLGLGVIQLGGAELDAPSPFGPRPEWSVAPNPVENRRIVLRGVSDFSQVLAAELYQLDGALVAQKVLPPIPGQDFSLDLASTLTPGLYFLVISQGEQQKHFRLWIR